jgi:hypothetical protein
MSLCTIFNSAHKVGGLYAKSWKTKTIYTRLTIVNIVGSSTEVNMNFLG